MGDQESSPAPVGSATQTRNSLSQISSQHAQEIWAETLVTAKKSLKKDDMKYAVKINDVHTFSANLETKSRAFGKSTLITRTIEKLGPALAHLQSFSEAIKLMVQADSTGAASLIWGTLTIALTISLRYIDILEKVVDMFVDITRVLPRFDLYLSLFASEGRLVESISTLYSDYIHFALQTIKFIKKRPFRILLTLFWKSLQDDFSKAKTKIEKDSAVVEDEARAANYIAEKARNDDAIKRHQEIVRIIPDIEVRVKHRGVARSIPVQRNPKFFGRKEELDKIFAHLRPRELPKTEDQLRSFTLHGMGGVGKTQTATEFVYKFLDDYPVIFWFRSERPAILVQEYADAAIKIGLVPKDQAPDTTACLALLKAWLFETDQKWLIVFDNVEKWEDVQSLWPSSTHGSILLTTRSAEIALNTTDSGTLEPYNTVDGARFFRELLASAGEDVTEDADKVASEIDGYPLALSHAAGYITTHHITCTDFLELYLDLQHARTVNRDSVSLSVFPEYGHNLEDVWTISLKNLPIESREVLNVTAFLNPDEIQFEILQNLADASDGREDHRTIQSSPAKIQRLGSILRSLSQHTLLHQTQSTGRKSFSIHRLLQRDLLLRLNEDSIALHSSFRKASNLVRGVFPRQYVAEPLTPFWPQCQKILPHVMRLKTVYSEVNTLTKAEEFASLLGDAAYYQWEKGLLQEALELCYLARDILDEVADDASLHKADVLNVIGAIYIESGAAHIDEGTRLMERVLEIRRNRLNLRKETDNDFQDDFICVSNALSNLSCCWIGLRDWVKGEQAIKESILMFERYCSHESHSYGFAERLANAGHVAAGQGRLEEGINFVKQATELQRAAFGQEDVRGCVFETYWANLLLQAGQLDEAYERHEAALRIRRKALGPGSNDVAKSLYFVAYCLYLQEKYEASEQLLAEAQGIYPTVFWNENRIARALFLQSMIKSKQGKLEEAGKLREEAGSLRQQLVGIAPKDTDTLELYERMVFYH